MFIKENIIQHMTYLLLPSSRLALYLAEQKTIKILPIRAEQYTLHHQSGTSYLATTFYKTFQLYSQEELLKATKNEHIVAHRTVQFNKKLESLVSNKKNSFYVIDKFGDISSLKIKGQQKYLNSNLGIPTFLSHIKGLKKNYLVVGDQDTKIKIYNQGRMHEIIAIWFILKKVALTMLQPLPEVVVVVAKMQSQLNLQMQQGKVLDQFLQLHECAIENFESENYAGRVFHTSKIIEGKDECKYQTVIYSKTGELYLLKLFPNHIKIVVFNRTKGYYEQAQTKIVDISNGEWDYLHGSHLNNQLVIVYGKNVLHDGQLTLNSGQAKSGKDCLYCDFNQNEHLIVVQL